MAETVDAGSVELDSIKITTFTGGNPQEISHLVTAVDIFESLDNYTIVCDIMVTEGIELMNFLPIGAEEKVTFKIKTPASGKEISYNFFVESITNMQSNDMSSLKSYVLRCVTMDAMKNSYSLFTKRYKDMEYVAALKEVVQKDLGSGKTIETPDGTNGFFDYTVNRTRPFQVIDLICERAVSKEHKGSDYIFYEDNEKYQFLTIEHLIETRKSKASQFEFEYPTGTGAEDVDKRVNHRNILKYEVFNQGDSMNKIKQGAHKNKYVEFDILHGDYFAKQEYVNSVDHKSFKNTDSSDDIHSSSFNSFAETSPSIVNLALKDGTRPEMRINQHMHYKAAFRQKIFAYGMNLRVYGDTNLMVGDCIDIKVPEITALSTAPDDQEVYSGIFLVKTIRHMLNKQKEGTGKFEHFMVLDCRRPNLKRSLG